MWGRGGEGVEVWRCTDTLALCFTPEPIRIGRTLACEANVFEGFSTRNVKWEQKKKNFCLPQLSRIQKAGNSSFAQKTVRKRL